VLAMAVHAARRRGTAMPVPVTLRFPTHPESDETQWQNLVVEHLGLKEWIVIERPDADLLDPAITALLRSRGLIYPSQIGSYIPIVNAASGGMLLTGEGGDESFGGWQLRPALHPIAWGPTAAARSVAIATIQRGPAFARRWYRRRSQPYPWLTDAGQGALDAALTRTEREPLGWDHYMRWAFARTAWMVAQRTLDAVGDTADCRIAHPLADPTLLSALASAWPRRGPGDRTDVMQSVVGDLLPRGIVEREGKAILASVFIGAESRAFIERWDGSGVDPEWVDEAALREVWDRKYPYAGSFNLLHQAWLAAQA
jgi:asparagine synthase